MQYRDSAALRHLAVRVPDALLEAIDSAARLHDVTRAVIVREALRHGLQLGPRPGFGTVAHVERGGPTG